MKNERKFKIPFVIILSLLLLNINMSENKAINKIRKFYPRNEALNKARHYLDLCLEGKLINNQKFNISEKIKITVIIPIYNSEKYIKASLLSIQNQKMKDNWIIKKLKEEDPRIRIINNEKNMGILYTRSISALEAKGEYILTLDHDDFFADDDYLMFYMKKLKMGR